MQIVFICLILIHEMAAINNGAAVVMSKIRQYFYARPSYCEYKQIQGYRTCNYHPDDHPRDNRGRHMCLHALPVFTRTILFTKFVIII